jgi:hypothetical protein
MLSANWYTSMKVYTWSCLVQLARIDLMCLAQGCGHIRRYFEPLFVLQKTHYLALQVYVSLLAVINIITTVSKDSSLDYDDRHSIDGSLLLCFGMGRYIPESFVHPLCSTQPHCRKLNQKWAKRLRCLSGPSHSLSKAC